MRAVYGPVRSWRLGLALGVDPICRQPKICNLKCIYCRLGHGGLMITERCRFVDERQVLEEAKEILREEKIETVEFRGTGEPFLAKNIVDMVRCLRGVTDCPVGVITNGSLFRTDGVLEELDGFDIVVVKIDASDEQGFELMNRPHSSIKFDGLIEGIRNAKKKCECDLRVQVTFVRANMYQADTIAETCGDLGIETVYLSTPLKNKGQDLAKKDMNDLAKYFKAFKVRTIFGSEDID